MKIRAQFELTELDELAAELVEIETGNTVGRVSDDPADGRPFQEQVRAWATANGWEIEEWDRRALMA